MNKKAARNQDSLTIWDTSKAGSDIARYLFDDYINSSDNDSGFDDVFTNNMTTYEMRGSISNTNHPDILVCDEYNMYMVLSEYGNSVADLSRVEASAPCSDEIGMCNGRKCAVPFEIKVPLLFYRRKINSYDCCFDNIDFDIYVDLGADIKNETGYSLVPYTHEFVEYLARMTGKLFYDANGNKNADHTIEVFNKIETMTIRGDLIDPDCYIVDSSFAYNFNIVSFWGPLSKFYSVAPDGENDTDWAFSPVPLYANGQYGAGKAKYIIVFGNDDDERTQRIIDLLNNALYSQAAVLKAAQSKFLIAGDYSSLSFSDNTFMGCIINHLQELAPAYYGEDTDDLLEHMYQLGRYVIEGRIDPYEAVRYMNNACRGIWNLPGRVTSLEITSPPNKTVYLVGDRFDITGMVVIAHYDNGTTKQISLGRYSGYTMSSGMTYVEIEYNDYGKKFYVRQPVTVHERDLCGITVEYDTTREWKVGERVTKEFFTVTAAYESGGTRVVDSFTLSGDKVFTEADVGTYVVTVTYSEGGKTFTKQVPLNVVHKPVKLTIISPPLNLRYDNGDTVNSDGVSLSIEYNNGSKKTVTSGYDVTPNVASFIGNDDKAFVTVSYTEGGATVSERLVIYRKNVKSELYAVKPAPLADERSLNSSGTGTVDLFTGALIFEHGDVAYSGNNLPLMLSHVYNSRYAASKAPTAGGTALTKDMGYGTGWRLNLNQRIISYTDGGKDRLVYIDAAGEEHLYVRLLFEKTDYLKMFISDEGADSKIGVSRNYYELIDEYGNILYFARSGGRLIKSVTADNITMTVTYENANSDRITSVTDGAGKTAEFTYMNGKLRTITEPTGKTTKFSYTGDLLTEIACLNGNGTALDKTLLSYKSNTALLTRITDPVGSSLNYEYADAADGECFVNKIYTHTTAWLLTGTTVTGSYDEVGDSLEIKHYKGGEIGKYTVGTKTKSGECRFYHFDSVGNCCLQYESASLNGIYEPKNVMFYNYSDRFKYQSLKIPPRDISENLLPNGGFDSFYTSGNTFVCTNWYISNATTYTRAPSVFGFMNGYSLILNGKVFQQIDLDGIKSDTHYLLSAWIEITDELSGTHELRAVINYTDGRTDNVVIPVDTSTAGVKFIGKVVEIGDKSAIESITVEIENTDANLTGDISYDEVRFEEITDITSIENIPYMLCYPVSVNDNNIYKYSFADVLSVSDFNRPITDLTPELLYYEILSGNSLFSVTFKDRKSYQVGYMDLLFSGETVVYKNGTYTRTAKNINKDVCEKIITDPEGNEFATQYTYDSQHELIKAVDYRDVTVENTKNGVNIMSELYPLAASKRLCEQSVLTADKNHTASTVDERSSAAERIATSYEYDTTGNIKKITSANGDIVNYEYDTYTGQLKKISATVGGKTFENTYEYNKGLPVTINVNGTDFYKLEYDGFGNVVHIFHNDTSVYYSRYMTGAESGDYAESVIDEKIVRTYYDARGRAVKTVFDGKTYAESEFDEQTGRLSWVRDYSINAETDEDSDIINYLYTYDITTGDLIAVGKYGAGHTLKTRKTVANGRTAMENIVIDGDSYTMSYEYENDDGAVYPENELCKITYSGTNVSCAAEYIRDGYGRQSDRKITVGGNTKCKESRTYMDIASDGEYTHGKTTRFVTQLKNTFGGTTETLTYTYTKNGEIQTVKVGNTVKQKFTYDALGRLTREDNKALNKTTVYTYDERGRMSSKRISAYTTASDPTGSTVNYAYASDHLSGRITEYNGKKLSDYKSAPYDSDGYPLVYFKHSGTGHYAMTWGRHTLREVKIGSKTIKYAYDMGGMRLSKEKDGTVTEYIYLGNKLMREIRNGEKISYIYGKNEIIGFEYRNQIYYYVKDLQGDIIGIIDKTGTPIAKYEYDAWGNHRVYNASGSENTEDSFIGNINAIRYRGYYYDTETGLYYLQTRYYDSETGRFISPDSGTNIEPTSLGEMGLYAYCGYNPVMNVDPSGEFAVSVFWVGIALSAAYGALVGIKTASAYGTDWWKGAIAGAFAGAIMGVAFGAGSGLGASALLGSATTSASQIAISLAFTTVLSIGGGMASYALDTWAYETEFKPEDMIMTGLQFGVEGALNFGAGYLLGANGYYRSINEGKVSLYKKIKRFTVKSEMMFSTKWLVSDVFERL